MKISYNELVNVWNSLIYISSVLIDNSDTYKSTVERMKLDSISHSEDKRVQGFLHMKPGDKIDAPYNLFVNDNKDRKSTTKFIHLYLVNTDKRIGRTTIDNFFSEQIPTHMIFVDKNLFMLNSNDIENIANNYYNLFDWLLYSLSDNNGTDANYIHEIRSLALFLMNIFLRINIPESVEPDIEKYVRMIYDKVSINNSIPMSKFRTLTTVATYNEVKLEFPEELFKDYMKRFISFIPYQIISTNSATDVRDVLYEFINEMSHMIREVETNIL